MRYWLRVFTGRGEEQGRLFLDRLHERKREGVMQASARQGGGHGRRLPVKVDRANALSGLTLVVLIMAAASVYPFCLAYKSEVAMTRGFLRERAHTVLLSLKAGILAHGRMGRYHAEKLAAVFDELAQDPNVLALQLSSPSGAIIVSSGDTAQIPAAAPDGQSWLDRRFVDALRIDLQGACEGTPERRGRVGRYDLEDWAPFEAGAYRLVTVLDATGVQRAISRHRLHLALSVFVILAAFALATLAFRLLLKRSELAAELERQREQSRRHEQVARLGAGLAHETKNPLGIIRGLAQSIGECTRHDCPVKDRSKDIVDEVDRVVGVINSVLTLSRPPDAAPTALDLDHFFADFLPLVQMDAAAAEVAVRYQPCGFAALADESLLRRALLNLILNALRASKPSQAVEISASRAGPTLTLCVADSGCGIAPDDLAQVTEPYFTRFPGGTGLGLSIVESIASAHGWRLRLESGLGLGTKALLENIQLAERA